MRVRRSLYYVGYTRLDAVRHLILLGLLLTVGAVFLVYTVVYFFLRFTSRIIERYF
jgi:uncharacterized membrane protein